MRFLGTAAADCIPNPFCDCSICEEARHTPSLQRLRSALLLDPAHMIDSGPDLAAAAMRWQLDLSAMRHVLITHTHEDHFCPSNAGLLMMSRVKRQEPLHVWLSEDAYRVMTALVHDLETTLAHLDVIRAVAEGRIVLHALPLFEPRKIGDYTVTAIRTTHVLHEGEAAVNYLITNGEGRTLLYACDTGLYPPDTLEYLEHRPLDLLIMEATFGSFRGNDRSSHLNVYTFLEQVETLRAGGTVREHTAIYATHINHKHDLNHDAMQRWFDRHAPQKIIVASDGLSVDSL